MISYNCRSLRRFSSPNSIHTCGYRCIFFFSADVRGRLSTCFQPPNRSSDVVLCSPGPWPSSFPSPVCLFRSPTIYFHLTRLSVLIIVPVFSPSSQSHSMAFFSQKGHKTKRNHSTERKKPHSTESTSSTPFPLTRTESPSRPTTIYELHSTKVHVQLQGPDSKPPTSKLNTAPSTPKLSLRRVPVPSLSVQEFDKAPYDHQRISPILPSSRSTSISGKSSIADIGGAYNATPSKTKPDHLKPADNTRIRDPQKAVPPIADLPLVSSPTQLTTPMSSPNAASQKPKRAVLRRKSNAKHPKSQPSVQSPTNTKSKYDLGISPAPATPHRTDPSPAQESPHSVPTLMSSDAAHPVNQSTNDERKHSIPGNTSLSLSLTPAGAVAAAYKEQEKRRKGFVRPNPGALSRGGSCDEDGGVYYTVFGSSGEVVAVGSPQDGGWSHHDLSNCPPNKAKPVSRKPSLGALGKLSRKSSTKPKKSNTPGIMSESECGLEKVTKDEGLRRSSLQARRSASVPGKHRSMKSLGIPAHNSDFGLVWDSPQSSSTPSKSGSVDEPPSAGGKIWKLMKRISTGGLREKYQAQEAAPPVPALPERLLPPLPPTPKFKAHSAPHSPNDSKPPPSRYVRGRSSFGDAPFTNRHKNMPALPSPTPSYQPPTSSAKNPSYRRQSTNTRSSSPVSSDLASSKYWQKSRTSSVSTFDEIPPLPGRIVISEQILSPSELCRLEREQGRAELSSPASTVDSHSPAASSSNHHKNTVIIIRKPSLQGPHMQLGGEDSEPDCVNTELTALPTPPRHHYKSNPHVVYHQSNDSGLTVGSTSASPTMPMFSTLDVVNQFHSATGSGVGMSRSSSLPSTPQPIGTLSNEPRRAATVHPPPRPQRSVKRKPVATNQHIATRASLDHRGDGRDGYLSQGALPSVSASLPRERTLGLSSGLDDDGEGRSYGTFGNAHSKGLVQLVHTPRDSSSSWESLKLSSSIHSRSPLKFREITSGEGGVKDRRALTEKEKADKWEDLLEMSDRAGGTIHIGNATLPSDSLRFSDYSTLTTLAL